MNDSNTTLHPPWLNVARALWLICTISATIIAVVGVVRYLNEPLPSCAPGTLPCAPWMISREDMALAEQEGISTTLMQLAMALNFVLPRIGFLLVGLLIFWRKPDDWMALLLSLMLTGFMVEGVTQVGVLTPFVVLTYIFITAVFLLLPFIFPNGRFVPGWTRWAAPIILVLSIPPSSLPQLFPTWFAAIDERLLAFWILGAFFLWFVVGGYAVIYRYRRVSNPQERQQTKWVMAGILGTFVIFIPFTIISVAFPPS